MRSLYILAHPDDDLLFFNPDIAEQIADGGSVELLYLTGGEDGKGLDELTRKLDALQAVYGAFENVTFHTLAVKSNSIRTGDTWGDLYHMFHAPDFKSKNLSGRPIDRQWLIRQLEMYVFNFKPDTLHIHSPFADPAIDHDEPQLDHLDHVYAGKFASEATAPFQLPTYAYVGYPIRQLEPNLNAEQVSLKTAYWRTYQQHEPEVRGEQWDVALSRQYRIEI